MAQTPQGSHLHFAHGGDVPNEDVTPPSLALAAKVNELLAALAGELEVASHPQHLARQSLGVSGMGFTKVAYNDEAFRAWAELHRRDPGDLSTVHHLAIMHHARAFDLEAGPEPTRADEDWRAALGYWHKLWSSDAFWERLAEHLPADGRGKRQQWVAELRASWPQELLQVHFDIAFDPGTLKRQRVSYHVRLALDSPFEAEAKGRVREETYRRWVTERVEPEAWQGDMLDPELIAKAAGEIERYLERDPGCLAALSDLLCLQERQLRAWSVDLGAHTGEEGERDAIFRRICESAAKWCPYLQQLLDRVESLREKPEVKDRLCSWYEAMGMVHRNVKRFGDAAGYLADGVKAAEDDERRRELDGELGEALALEACEVAASEDPTQEARARAMCDRVRERPRLTMGAQRFLANAYMLLREFDQAERLCDAALSTEPDVLDPDELEAVEEQKAKIAELRQSIAGVRRRSKARELANRAAEEVNAIMANQSAPAYQREEVLTRAMQWLTEANALDPGSSYVQKNLSALQELLGHVRGALQHAQEYGGGRALDLQQQAVRAFNAGRHDEAIERLRQAINVSANDRKLKEELSQTLTGAAVAAVNKAGPAGPRDILEDAQEKLEEAQRLDPSNKQAMLNLLVLKGTLLNR